MNSTAILQEEPPSSGKRRFFIHIPKNVQFYSKDGTHIPPACRTVEGEMSLLGHKGYIVKQISDNAAIWETDEFPPDSTLDEYHVMYHHILLFKKTFNASEICRQVLSHPGKSGPVEYIDWKITK